MVALENIISQQKLRDEIKAIREEKKRLDEKIRDLHLQIRVSQGSGDGYDGKSETKYKFIRPCPAPECRGFLSQQYKCGICENYACSCHVIKMGRDDPDHKCHADDVKSVELINKETKPCPACGSRVLIGSGCFFRIMRVLHFASSAQDLNFPKFPAAKFSQDMQYTWLKASPTIIFHSFFFGALGFSLWSL
jgi:hypothetical protein